MALLKPGRALRPWCPSSLEVAVIRTRKWSRRLVALVTTAALAGCTSTAQDPGRPQASSSDTATHRVETTKMAQLVDAFFEKDAADAFRNRQALVISVDGHLVLERYWDSTATTSGNIESVGKTILSTLIGIALEEGSLRSL